MPLVTDQNIKYVVVKNINSKQVSIILKEDRIEELEKNELLGIDDNKIVLGEFTNKVSATRFSFQFIPRPKKNYNQAKRNILTHSEKLRTYLSGKEVKFEIELGGNGVVICEFFGCPTTLSITEQLFGRFCINHQNLQKVDIGKVVKRP